MRAMSHVTGLTGCWLLILLAGCKTAANTGPIYKLHPPVDVALQAPVAVSVTDKRPANEQKYKPGAINPVDYQQGVEILSLDNFEPQITELLKQACTQQLATLPEAPTWADIEVTRFRVVIDRREILAAEYERQLEMEQAAPVVGLGAGMMQGDVRGIVGGVGAGLVTAAMAANKIQEVENHRTGWQHSAPGVTCEMELHVVLHWPGNRRETCDIQARSYSITLPEESLHDALKDMKWNIPPTVDTAISQASIKLHQQAEAVLKSAGAKPQGPAIPQSARD